MVAVDIPVLDTERLRLRAFTAADLDAYAAFRADAEVARYITGPQGWSREESARHMAAAMGHWVLYGFGLWGVESRAEARLIGIAGVFDYVQRGIPEVGWAFARETWGQGYASEAVRAVLTQAFTVWGHARLECAIKADNAASLRMAARLGFVPARLDTRRDSEVQMFALTREAWAAG